MAEFTKGEWRVMGLGVFKAHPKETELGLICLCQDSQFSLLIAQSPKMKMTCRICLDCNLVKCELTEAERKIWACMFKTYKPTKVKSKITRQQ